MPKRDIEDRIADLQQQQAQLRAQEKALKDRMSAQRRKDDARRHILLGMAVEALWDKDAAMREAITRELPKHTKRKRDAALLAQMLRSTNAE